MVRRRFLELLFFLRENRRYLLGSQACGYLEKVSRKQCAGIGWREEAWFDGHPVSLLCRLTP